MDRKKSILFLCTGNSCRSQMAEGFMKAFGGDRFEVFSAGSRPEGYVHPLAIETMKQLGIDISSNRSKSVEEFLQRPIDILITVCDNAKEACPVLPGHPATAHWGFEDPAKYEGSREEQLAFYRKIAGEIEQSIRRFLSIPTGLTEADYHKAVQEIGL